MAVIYDTTDGWVSTLAWLFAYVVCDAKPGVGVRVRVLVVCSE